MRLPASVYVLAIGAFALISTELGIIGLLPQLSTAFEVTIGMAGWLLSGFALAIAVAGPGMTLLFTRLWRGPLMRAIIASKIWPVWFES